MDIVLGRRALRRYEQRPVPLDVVEALLTAAIWAPSAHNRQPWRFVVITDETTKLRLARAMGIRLMADLRADGVPEHVIAKDVNRSFERITLAPVLVLLCLTMTEMDAYPDERRSQKEFLLAVQSTAMAGQNFLLAAHAHGLGACWMCAPLFVPGVVQETLDLPDDWQPQSLLTLGYPAQTRAKTRQPLETRVLWR